MGVVDGVGGLDGVREEEEDDETESVKQIIDGLEEYVIVDREEEES